MGARQTGKSTLVRHAPLLRGYTYLTLDSLDVRHQALSDPEGLVTRAPRMILDEVQRAPDLLLAIKAAVDAGARQPGRFVLTGSANLLAMKAVKETLAGRASYVTLWPLTRRERLGSGRAGAWSELLATPPERWLKLLAAQRSPREDWRAAVRRSGYPPTAIARWTPAQQADWLQGYLDGYVVRDVPELSQLARPLDLLRLMRAAALSIGQVEHQVTWARTTGLSSSTVSRWTDLLEVTYQILRVPAYSVNRTKRLTKSPKVYWSNTAFALHLAGRPEPTGFHLENFVLTDLVVWCWSQSPRPAVLHWRTVDQLEVNFVQELPTGRLLPIEVKAMTKPGWSDVPGLRTFLEEYADLAPAGIVLHGGTETYSVSGRIVATPWWHML
jgi:predicted AAA+ superfamily ATPase